MFLREGVDGCEHAPALRRAESRLLDGWGRIHREAILGYPEGESGSTPGSAPRVAGLVGHDAQQPWAEGRLGAEPRQRLPCLHECFLGDVGGVVGATDEVGDPDRDVLVALHQLLKGTDVASACAFDQLCVVVQWTAPHGLALARYYTASGRRVPMEPTGTRRCTRGMKRRVVVSLALAAASVLVPTAASAKGGPTLVVVDGPGLDEPIRLPGPAATELPTMLIGMLGVDGSQSGAAPTERLGPRYVATFSFMGPSADEERRIRKQLYPFADGGPLVHTPRRQTLGGEQVAAGWQRADDRLDSFLVSLGVPAPAGADLEWLTYHEYEHGLSISYPPSWQPARSKVAPVLLDPVIPVALGTYDFPTEGCGAVPGPALQALGRKDAFIAVYVFRGASWSATVTERPARFGPDLPWSEGPGKCANDVRGTIRSLSFPDHGLRLDVMLAIGEDASTPRRNQVYRILDTLTVEQHGSGRPLLLLSGSPRFR